MDDAQVQRFLDCEKEADGLARWKARAGSSHVARVRLLGCGGGHVTLVVAANLERVWTLKVEHDGEEILMWHFTEPHSHRRHSNPSRCPADYAGNVTASVHEHRWCEGCGSRCSRPLFGLDDAPLDQAVEAFCRRANIAPGFYTPPPLGQVGLTP